MTSIKLRLRDSQSRDCTTVTLLNPPSREEVILMFPIGRRVKIFVSPLEGGLRGMTMTSIRLRLQRVIFRRLIILPSRGSPR
jgi:hypothetical protein